MTRQEAWVRFAAAIMSQALVGQRPPEAAINAALTADLLLAEMDKRFTRASLDACARYLPVDERGLCPDCGRAAEDHRSAP